MKHFRDHLWAGAATTSKALLKAVENALIPDME